MIFIRTSSPYTAEKTGSLRGGSPVGLGRQFLSHSGQQPDTLFIV